MYLIFKFILYKVKNGIFQTVKNPKITTFFAAP